MKIPIVIGVSGHRNIKVQDIPILKEKVTTLLSDLKQRYPHSDFLMLNSVAAGSDQLCCEVADSINIPYHAILPMQIERYRTDFDESERTMFERCIQNALSTIIAPEPEVPDIISNDAYYRQAGLYINQHCHFLLALWDGEPGTLNGCGTATMVHLQQNNMVQTSGLDLSNIPTGYVIQIVTPRQDRPIPQDAFMIKHMEKGPVSLDDILKQTDFFNHQVDMIDHPICFNLVEDDLINLLPDQAKQIQRLYQSSDSLSLYYRKRYMESIKWMSIFAVSLVVSFLLYDELEADLFLPLYGLFLIVASAVLYLSKRRCYHQKYLEYRVLAETLRTQFYISLLDHEKLVCDYFGWSQRNIAWIRYAVAAVMIAKYQVHQINNEKIQQAWISDQLSYFHSAIKKTKEKSKTNDTIEKWMIKCSLSLFIIIIVFEGFFKNIMEIPLAIDYLRHILMIHDQDIVLRGIFKILLGLISSATLFVANYYGKLSLNRKIKGYQKMIQIYQNALDALQQNPEKQIDIFNALAKEEILENNDWLEYCMGNDITINV